MAFGGTIKRGARIDTRRRRRIDPCGPYPEEQAKLIGSKTSLGLRDYDYDRRPFCRKIAKEMREPDMTPVPRHAAERPLYVPGSGFFSSEVLDDEALDLSS